MTAARNILIVEDEAQIRKFLRISLEAHHFDVQEARLGADGLHICAERTPDLVILDLGLPDMDGEAFITRLREWSEIPVIVLSVRDQEAQKVSALDLGANDYVTKPFGIGELIARIRVLLRSQADTDEQPATLRTGDLELNRLSREVSLNGQLLHLAPKEYTLLHLLMSRHGRVLTHGQILSEIWGPARAAETHYLRVLVRQLRIKLGDDPAAPRYIQTVQGVGYRLASS